MKKFSKLFSGLTLGIISCCLVLSGCGETPIYFKSVECNYSLLEYHQAINEKQGLYLDEVVDIARNDMLITTHERTYFNNSVENLKKINTNLQLITASVDAKANLDSNNSSVLNIYDFSAVGLGKSVLMDKDVSLSTNTKTSLFISTPYRYDVAGYPEILSPIEVKSLNENIKIDNLCDLMDEEISTWGNMMYFDVELKTNNYIVNNYQAFKYPTVAEIPEMDELTNGGVKIVRNDAKAQIIVVYKIDSITYSKVISFGGDEKVVTKWNGDVSLEGVSTSLGEYKYTYKPGILTGEYEIRYTSKEGYLQCKYTPDTERRGFYSNIETYLFENSEIITRISNVNGTSGIVVQDYWMAENGVDGKFKTKKENGNLEKIVDLTTFTSNDYAEITKAERKETNLVISYEFYGQKLVVDSINTEEV